MLLVLLVKLRPLVLAVYRLSTIAKALLLIVERLPVRSLDSSV